MSENNTTQHEIEEGKTMAILSYVMFVGTLIAWSMNTNHRNRFASFHIRQAIGLDILFILLGVLVSGFDTWFISAPFYLFVMVLWGYGLAGAVMGKIYLMPIFGNFFQKWLRNIA